MKPQRLIMPLPKKPPRDFLRRLGYRGNVRLLAVLWHRPKECVLCFDGVSFMRASNDNPFIALCERLDEWSKERKVRLKPPRANPTHWLLLDLRTEEAYAARSEIARRAAIDQKYPEEMFSDQKRLF